MSPGSSTGRVVAGRYRIVAPIGSGGHGVVDLAEDLLNGGRRVALKRLEGIVGAGDPEPAAEHLRWFRHPRWAEVLDEGRLDAHGRFQVLRYVEGASLDHIELPRPASEILAFLEDGARVLGALHARGLIHYDVTPGNFLREERHGVPTFTLTDGGLASLGPVRGIARGTVLYMAPEVADGAPHDHRADLYAMGLVAFRLATGRDPWVGGAGDVLGGRRREVAPLIRSFRPDADARVERVIAALLERNPDRRLPDAQAVLSLLVELGSASAAKRLEGESFAAVAGGFIVGRGSEIDRFRAACRALVTGPRPAPPPSIDAADSANAHAPPALTDNVLIVTGPTGSGGTRLVEEYAAFARAEGVPVLSVSGREGAADRRGPLRRLADGIALLTGQADVSAASGRADARPGREDLEAGDDVRTTERFIALCDKTADKSPLVLIVEDFEEFPESARESIRVLARHLLSRSEHPDGRAPARVLLVVDHGSEEPDSFLLPDATDPRRPIQVLAPLTADAIRALATDRFAALDPLPEDVETVRAATEGLPRLVVAVMTQALDRGDLRRENDVWIWNASATPTYALDRSISPASARAIAGLSPAAREVAEYLALLEVPVPEDFLRRLVSADAISEFARTPLASVSYEGEYVRFALCARDERLALLPAAQSATLGRLSCRASPPEQVPLDLIPELARIASARGNADVSLELLTSVAKSPSSAWANRAHAAALLALGTMPQLSTTQRHSLSRLLNSGPNSTALADAIERTLTEITADDLPTVARLARHHIRGHNSKKALELCARAANSLDAPQADRVAATRVAVLELRARRSIAPPAVESTKSIQVAKRLRALGTNARRTAPDLGCEFQLARGREFISSGRFARAIGVHRRALRRSIAANDRTLLVSALNNCAVAHRATGNLVTAERYLLRALRVRLASGDASGAAGQAHNLARVYQRAGRLRDAAALLHRAIAMAARHGQATAQSLALGILSEVQDQIGSTDLARVTCLRALSVSRKSHDERLVVHNLLVSAELTSALGDNSSARTMLREAASSRGVEWRERAPSIRLCSLQISNNLGTHRRPLISKRTHRRPRTLLRLLRLARSAYTSGLPITEDLHGRSASPSLRNLLATIISFGARPPDIDYSVHVESLRSPAIKGSSRRLGLGLLIEALDSYPVNDPQRTETLRRIADLAKRFDLPRFRARAHAVSARDALRSGDVALAALNVATTLDALESRGAFLGASAVWPRSIVPREVWDIAQTYLDNGTESSNLLADHHDSHIVLHAMAHRLSRRSSPTLGVDSRRESALRAVLASAAQFKARVGVDPLLTSLSEHARRITRAERACVVLISSADGTRRVAGSSSDTTDLGTLTPLSSTVIERALSTRSPLLLHDVFGDSELMARPSVLTMSLRSVLCVPLVRGGETYGVMYADSSEGAGSFDQVDLEIFSLFAEQASAALETARLVSDLQQSYAELKSTQDRLVRGERLRVMGELTSGVAHEFNNLLTAILARVQLMDLGELPADVRVHLGLIERASLDAAAVVRRLQGFTRTQRQGSHRAIDLGEIGGDVVEFLRPLWTTRRRHGQPPILVRYRATRGLVVQGDSTELREVFTNLLKNSLEALDVKGGTISIVLTEHAGFVRTEVNDDGGGIAPEIVGRLFTPFLTTKGDRGTGLGLCLCQQILERHGTVLKITSNPPIGTNASFELARTEVPQTDAPAMRETENERPIRVLVVDDDPNVLRPLCDYLELSGLVVAAAESGQKALDASVSFRPDVVVSDIAMPGMDGIELCTSLRRASATTPVVLMSGQASEVDLGRLRDSGAAALLPKPFTMRQILELLRGFGSHGATEPMGGPLVPPSGYPNARSQR